MGLIREPKEVDFYVDPRPLTKTEEKAISEFIKADKLKQANIMARKAKTRAKV